MRGGLPCGRAHPTPDEANYDEVEMLYIDPEECIDCDACVEACPVDAIFAEDQLRRRSGRGSRRSTPTTTSADSGRARVDAQTWRDRPANRPRIVVQGFATGEPGLIEL